VRWYQQNIIECKRILQQTHGEYSLLPKQDYTDL